MRTVHKYVLALSYPSTWRFNVPSGAKVRLVEPQTLGSVCIWMEVNTGAGLVSQAYEIVGTGHPISDGASHIGSCVSGPYVWHVYLVA